MAGEETEITLGAGKLLGLFLMLAVTCGIFFAVGYSLGKSSSREDALKNLPAQSDSATPSSDRNKPLAVPAPADAATPRGNSAESGKDPSPDLTFYKAVKENPKDDTNPAQRMKSTEPAVGGPGQTASVTKQGETTGGKSAITDGATGALKAAPPAAPAQTTSQASPAGSYLVQIAAVSHEEDAAALAGALRKKSYGASVVNNPGGKDRLFHVVLGPYASLQDAEAMKAKLQGEGYNPIVKR